jgi:hypothetical protein
MRRLSALGALALVACGNATSTTEAELSDPGPRDASYDVALELDGIDDYASIGTSRAPHVKRDQTIMLWFRAAGQVSGGAALQVLFTLRRAEDSGFALALDGDAPLVYKVFGMRDLARATTAVSLGEWHHYAYVIAAEESLLYLDGTLAASGTSDLTNRTPTQAFLGSLDGYQNPFHGTLDALRVYERAFSAAEVAAVAAGEQPGEGEPLVIDLPFDEASGARAYDRSGLGNHAELGDGVAELMPTRIRR